MPVHSQFFKDQHRQHDPRGLLISGPVVQVEVHVPNTLASVLAQQGAALPPPSVGFALIDTGATRSAIDDSVAGAVGVQPVGTQMSGTAAGQAKHNIYPVRLNFPAVGPGLDVEFVSVIGVNMTGQTVMNQPLIALVGRDILSKCILSYNGPAGLFTLAW